MPMDPRISDMAWWTHLPAIQRAKLAHDVAISRAVSNRSDPFVYARTISHLLNNVHCPADFDGSRMG